MAKTNFTQADLDRMGMVQNKDGTFQKAKSKPQPRELAETIINDNLPVVMRKSHELTGNVYTEHIKSIFKQTGQIIFNSTEENNGYRTVKLTLFGEPMPKQSVRSFIRGNKIMHYQPKEMAERKYRLPN